jgi:hypothetical protein
MKRAVSDDATTTDNNDAEMMMTLNDVDDDKDAFDDVTSETQEDRIVERLRNTSDSWRGF